MTQGIYVAQPTKEPQADNRLQALEEVDRSLERELGLLADERKDRARRFGIEAGLVSPETGK